MKSLQVFIVPDFPPKLDYMLPSVFPQDIFSTKPLNLWPILQILLYLDITSAFSKSQAICALAVLSALCRKTNSGG